MKISTFTEGGDLHTSCFAYFFSVDLDQGQTMVSTTKSVPEPTDAMEVDEPVLSADLCESAVTTKVDVVPPSSVGDVFKSTEVAEVDVAMPSAVDVPASTEAQEVTSAVPSAVVSESSKTADCNVVVAGSDTSSKLVSCIHHFCSTSADPLDASKGRDSKLTPVLLKAATHAVEKAGTEGIDVQQLTNLLERMGKSCFHLLFSGTRAACEVGPLDVCL